MKIWDIVKDDFNKPSTIEEGWKNNVLATVLAVSSLFNVAKGGVTGPKGDVSVSQQVGDSMRLDIGKLFKSGQYQFHPEDEKIIQSELLKFGKEIQKNPVSDFVVQIVSSESQVPNYDAEPTSPTFKQRLDTMELARKRAETVDFIVKQFTEDLKKRGVLKGNVTFVQPQILMGKVPWDPKLGKDNQVYSKDQYVFVNIKIKKGGQPAQTTNNFDAFADMGEKVLYNNRAVGMVFYPTRKTDNQTQAGNTNTQYQDILFKVLKPETELTHGFTGKKNENAYVASYVIPWQWWNKNVFNSTLTQDNINYIKNNFKS